MPTVEEKKAFAARLHQAFSRLSDPVKKGPTQLALHFNLRHYGNKQITTQTAHKWLSGRSIPTPEKLETLAGWLGVNQHWLHYGPAPYSNQKLGHSKTTTPTPDTIQLAAKIESLPPHQRYLVEELVSSLHNIPSNEK